MSNFTKSGTLTANGTTDEVSGRGYVSLHATTTGGTAGTLAWQFKGPSGVWSALLNVTTALAGSADMFYTVYVGDDVKIRGNLTGSSGATWVWQIMSNPNNRF